MSSSTSTRRSSARSPPPPPPPPSESTSTYLTYPVSHIASSLYRRLTEPAVPTPPAAMEPLPPIHNGFDGVYTPPHRTASPFQPPPLTALTLRGVSSASAPSAQILSRALAEEIRLLVPPRLQLVTDWTLAYSVEQNGASLTTLYAECAAYRGGHNGFVLVVRDGLGGTFGAFLTDPPAPSPHYFGTGECFLWRASVLPTAAILASLPPPPSADTTHLQRSTTLASPTGARFKPHLAANNGRSSSGTSTPERIRFKAFPYSGVNDYMIYCQPGYLSVGGGDGKYGLWLDSVLERGISSHCLTFGNEGLSEEGAKFEILGVEVWYLGT
ncbi:oxidation resistance protein 1 [Xylographa parallela]|nr:oxidation resistance protein 1 [Xylographa parallela]